MSHWEAGVGAVFIFASAVVVAKLAELEFDRFFYAGASICGVVLVVSRNRLAYIAAAFGWMALRLLGAGAFTGNWKALGLGTLFGGVAYWTLTVALNREEHERIRR